MYFNNWKNRLAELGPIYAPSPLGLPPPAPQFCPVLPSQHSPRKASHLIHSFTSQLLWPLPPPLTRESPCTSPAHKVKAPGLHTCQTGSLEALAFSEQLGKAGRHSWKGGKVYSLRRQILTMKDKRLAVSLSFLPVMDFLKSTL